MGRIDSRYERLDAIERLLSLRPGGMTVLEIASALDVSDDTIRRDLMLLEARGTGLMKDGWRYVLDHRRAIYTLKLTNHEIMALYLAARLLSHHSDKHNPHVVRGIEKLADAIAGRSPLIARHMVQAAAVVRERPPWPEYLHALETITTGWAEGRKVHITYENQAGRVSERTIAPYFIEPSGVGYACHVIGFDDESQDLRTFKIERIRLAYLTDEVFDIPPTFDAQQLLANAWGVIWREAGTKVVLRFDRSVARRVKESRWHPSEEIVDLPDGSCRYTVFVGSTLEMKPWIRQWGAAVQVLAPADLRAEVAEEARAMAALYATPAEEDYDDL